MSTVSAPFGLRPRTTLDGRPVSNAIRLYPIASGYATRIDHGDPVIVLNTGAGRGRVQRFNETRTQATATAAFTAVGVLIGAQFTDPSTQQFTTAHYYRGGIAASDIFAMVVDDPDMLFDMQADGAVPITALGCNAGVIQTTNPSNTIGNSGLHVQASTVAATGTLPIRIVDFDTRPGNSVGDAFTNLVVRINTHFHRTVTGTAAS